MTSYLDQIENDYEAAETAAFFNIGVVNKPKEKVEPVVDDKETIPGTMGRATVKGAVKGMTELPMNLATIIGAPVDIVTAGLNKIGFDIQNPVMGSEFLQDGVKSIINIGEQLIPTSLNTQFNEYLSKPYDNQITGNLTEAISQFGTTAIPAASFVKLITNANAFTRSLMWGGIADATAFNADDKTLVGQLLSNPEAVDQQDQGALREMLVGLFTKYEDDPEAVKLAKSSLEGMGIGGLLEAAFRIGRKIPWKRVLQGGAVAAGSTASSEAEAGVIGDLIKRLSKAETAKLKADAKSTKEYNLVRDEALRIKNEYPTAEGWLPINIAADSKNPSFKIDKNGKIEIRWQQPSYAFHTPNNKKFEKLKGEKKTAALANHKQMLSDKMVSDVNAVLERAKNGDQGAIDIINQANWYRSMRSRLRREFGGLSDVFADILGATSAMTNVQQNYENALGVLRSFVRGDFDKQIEMYKKIADEGGNLSSTQLTAMAKDANIDFDLIRNAAGKLFGNNSPAATTALLDMFRQIKPGKAPKTINFTGNLIGFGNEATIDVWAARYLRDAAGKPRIPPAAEKAVAGKHLTKSTFENPQIGSEFGFGQEVFSDAANRLNAEGGIKAFNANIGDMGADDLQAVVWFLEKEKWTKNGWTTKAGEGGSLDFESVYGGSANPERVKELRSIINTADSTEAEKIKAADELKTLEGSPERTTIGVSRERPDNVPTNIQQADLSAELTSPLKNDDTVMAFQANSTYGEFMGELERSLNYEVVTRTNFNPKPMTDKVVEMGQKYNQDAVFVSKVVADGTDGARPGAEIYFQNRQNVDFAQIITNTLRARGIDGFTFITDARYKDRPDIMSLSNEPTAGLTGIRFQYIPEFDEAFDPSRAKEIFEEKEDLFSDVIEEISKIDGISFADVVNYQTVVYKNPSATWINGGVSYDEYFGTATR
tara:strand:+ start:4345 stop:7164 length:2820 start_codon:yes stop_codon:yes gene_type:complete